MANASRDGRALTGLLIMLLALVGCGGDDSVEQTSAAPSPTATPVAVATSVPTPGKTPDTIDIRRDKVERGVAPVAASAISGAMVVNLAPKRFVDPPLPPELNDDGGLKPLPKPGR